MYKVQQAPGHNPRGGVLRDIVKQTKEARDSRDRVAFVDRGAGGINAGYSEVSYQQVTVTRHLAHQVY